MSLKPLDFQVMVPKANEISRIEAVNNQKDHAVRQQQALSVKSEAENKPKQVTKRSKAEDARINDYRQRKNNEKNSGKKKKKNKNMNESDNRANEKGSVHIDIRL